MGWNVVRWEGNGIKIPWNLKFCLRWDEISWDDLPSHWEPCYQTIIFSSKNFDFPICRVRVRLKSKKNFKELLTRLLLLYFWDNIPRRAKKFSKLWAYQVQKHRRVHHDNIPEAYKLAYYYNCSIQYMFMVYYNLIYSISLLNILNKPCVSKILA